MCVKSISKVIYRVTKIAELEFNSTKICYSFNFNRQLFLGHLPGTEFWHSSRKQSASQFGLFWVSTCWWKDESNCSTNNNGFGKPEEYFHSSPVPGTAVFPNVVDCCLPLFYKPFWALLSPVPDCGVNRSTDKAIVRSNTKYKPRYPREDEKKKTINKEQTYQNIF